MSVIAPPMGRTAQPNTRRLTQGPSETDTRIRSSRPLTVTEWKCRITAHAERIGQPKGAESIKRMAHKLAKRDAAQGHMADPDVMVAGLFEQRDDPEPPSRLDHLDMYDPRVHFIPWSDPTGEDASAKVDRERAA